MTQPRTRVASIAATALLLAVASAGCSSQAEPDVDTATPDPSSSPGESALPENDPVPAVEQDSPLVLSTSTVRSRDCYPTKRDIADLAWFDVTWKASSDLDSFSFELVDPRGVKQVGEGVTVPPINFGGSIAYGGASTWRGRAKSFDSAQTRGSQADQADFHSPIEGETGMLALHLRFDQDVAASPQGATFEAVKATYTLPDGTSGETSIDIDQTWRRGRC